MIAGLPSLAAIHEDEDEGVPSKLRTDSPMSIPSLVGSASSDVSEGSFLDSLYGSPIMTPRKTLSSSPTPPFTPISSLVHGRASPELEEEEVVGISRPCYEVNEAFQESRTPITSNILPNKPTRIGITPSKYEQPDFPASPANLFLMHQASMMEKQQQEYVAPPSNMYFSEGRAFSPTTIHGDGVERTFHKPTAGGHFLVSASTAIPHPQGLRFDLGKGKAEIRKDEGAMVSGIKEIQLSPSSNDSTGSSVTTLSASVASSVQSCATPYKVFCLLLHPQDKIFELIQIIYSPDVTTVGDLLHLIPENASEDALGMQDYVALCRPKDGASRQAMSDVDAMASPGNHDEVSVGIKCGEILVPVPNGYTVEQMSLMSRAILKNPQILNLLQKSNPLAPRNLPSFDVHSTSSKMFISTNNDREDVSERRKRRKEKKKLRKQAANIDSQQHQDEDSSAVADKDGATLPSPAQPQSPEEAPVAPEASPRTAETEANHPHQHRRRKKPRKRIKKVLSLLRPHKFGFHHSSVTR